MSETEIDPLGSALLDVWERHADEDYRRDLAHWRGHGRWEEDAWLGSVRQAAHRVRDILHTVRRPANSGAIDVGLDWGAGGGASAVGLAPYCKRLVAVDVSSTSLAETRRQLAQIENPPRLSSMLVGSDPTVVAEQINEPIDLFFSAWTFHLFPTLEYGEDVLRTAYSIMRPGALGYVKFRFDDGTERYRPRPGIDQYREAHVFASSWSLSAMWRLLDSIGFDVLKIGDLNLDANFASVYFRK